MNKFILLLFLPLISVQCTEEKDPEVKVMTWNIWHGGLHGTKADNYAKDTSNTIQTTKVIQEAEPDILFMQETYCCGMESAQKAGFPYSVRASTNLSIHSKHKIIEDIRIFRPFNSHAAIIDFNGNKLLCINVWLHWLPDYFSNLDSLTVDSLVAGEHRTRFAELKEISRAIDSLQAQYNIPVIVGGDFNSGSHFDWTESTKDKHHNLVVEWPTSKLMATKGYTDTYREVNPDPSNDLAITWGYEAVYKVQDRIDFIYYRGNGLKTVSSRIVKENPTGGFFNSDHHAVLSTISLGGAK
ncbi:MAG: endonuclease/exonuclease/phosphatase family protein [Bacteroidales bacterium]